MASARVWPHWRMIDGRLLLPEAAGIDLLFARSDDENIFCRWLTLEEGAPHFGGELFSLWRGLCNVMKLVREKV